MKVIAILSMIFLTASISHAEVNADEMNQSNNPLTPAIAVNFHDYITSSIFGTDEDANTFLLRGAMPVMWGGMPQLLRATLPYTSTPGPDGDKVNGVGDFNIFDLFLAGTKDLQFGVGPYFVLPTASKDETGAGKWQLGAAGMVIAPTKAGLLGALVTYQHDFAGDSDRDTVNLATVQPFVIFNLPNAFYLRSTGIWNFNWETGDYYMPIGFGLGKIWKLQSGTTVNLFAEPQWTIAHEGSGAPNYQTFVGLNFQMPLNH